VAKKHTVLVTGGAGFIGRWVVKALLDDTANRVAVVDDLSNGCMENITEFCNEPRFELFQKGKVENPKTMESLFKSLKPAHCLHLAAQIIVQQSIDDPMTTFRSDVEGTFRLLELCRAHNTAMLFMSTCMVYDMASASGSINEKHPVLPRSPYAGAKLAAEHMCVSYAHAYGLPVTVIRPFNTYGPHQKSSGEGGVVSIFLHRALRNQPLCIYGDGAQTRDLLYVEDCVDFILRASGNPVASGQIFNAGTRRDVSINTLAEMALKTVPESTSKVKHIAHIHPQSEITKLCCNAQKAGKLLGWKVSTPLEKGLDNTCAWIAQNLEQGRDTWS
jgi:nucleoside-diphosphate-sugar epimerase